jgi:hypothetical protein
MDFQRAMPLALADMASVWGAAAGCNFGPDGAFGLRVVFESIELGMDMPRIHAVFDDIYMGVFHAFARCRAVNSDCHTLAETGDNPHRTMVGGYLRPNLVNIVNTYRQHTVEPVQRDQKESDRVDAKVDARLKEKMGAVQGAAAPQLAALQTALQTAQRDISALKRSAPSPQHGAPPPPPPGGPPPPPPQPKQPRQGPGPAPPAPSLAPLASAGAPQVPVPKDPGDFAVVAQDPVKLVERYEWVLHKAGKPPSCGWLGLFDACRLGAVAQPPKRACPRCAAQFTTPDKEAFLLVAASGMAPARAAELAAIKAKRGWG